MSDIPEEIMVKINNSYDEFFGTGYWEKDYKKHIVEYAKKIYHLRDKEVEEIRNAAIRQGNIATDRLNEMYTRIKELEEQISYLKVIADDE